MSKKVADGIRDNSGLWKHGHTYQVGMVSVVFILKKEC